MEPKRLFHGSGVVGPFDYHEFTLTDRGSSTVLHEHERPHMVQGNKPFGVYLITAAGVEQVEAVSFFDMRCVAAHRKHLVFAFEADTLIRCMFSKFTETGTYLANAKMESTRPYEEACDLDSLPQIVRDLLDV